MIMTYKFKKIYFFELPYMHVYEYYVKMAVIFFNYYY